MACCVGGLYVARVAVVGDFAGAFAGAVTGLAGAVDLARGFTGGGTGFFVWTLGVVVVDVFGACGVVVLCAADF